MVTQQELNYARIEKAINYLDAHFHEQPGLDELADVVGLSPHHFQRQFTEWAGISPKRFLQCLTAEYLKCRLAEYPNLPAAADAVGLSSPSRVFELFVNLEAVTPQAYKTQGQGLTLSYGVHDTPFGQCILVASERGITDLQFIPAGGEANLLAMLRGKWASATLLHAPHKTQPLVDEVFTTTHHTPLRVHLAGSPFQLKVWEALLRLPTGAITTYQALAAAIGQPQAAQAVGGAVGANPIAYLIPCHRVIRKTGILGEYRWGAPRKKAMLGRELGQYEAVRLAS